MTSPDTKTAITLFDSHCHFDFEAFDGQREAIWKSCAEKNIRQLLVPGTAPEHWPRQQQLAQAHQGIYTARGVHPWFIGDKPLAVGSIEHVLGDALQATDCVAIGECGLDKSIATPMEIQTHCFEQHMALACDTGMPLVIHAHKAYNEVLACIKRYRPAAGGVIHAFSGSLQMALDYWKLGFRLGIGGVITYPRANKTRNTVRELPIEAIVLETDAPDMPLHGHQGQANSPLRVYDVADCLAGLRGESLGYIATQTTANSEVMFRL